MATLLEDVLADPVAKVVVFSQWLRTHELIVRRLEARGWGHVLFHGGVPGDKRGALVDRFLGNADCRVFLSTDAGGVGLNLQHAAAIVVNMDMPWNPAVLEQRIGRVHRLGQTRGVQVVNFVARGTIEEGMLSVLAFKKSLFAGVLDGGQSEVRLEGTRLAKFMESVEQVTGAASTLATEASAEAETADTCIELPAARDSEDDDRTEPTDGSAANAATVAPAQDDPWAPLLAAGARFLGEIASAAQGGQSRWVETDPTTGQRHLRLPLPAPQDVQGIAEALMKLLAGRR